jgi:hypothetical protein
VAAVLSLYPLHMHAGRNIIFIIVLAIPYHHFSP